MRDEIEYPALPLQPLMTGDEPIRGSGIERAGTMLDYWRWAHSDLSANAERGLFAEYLVRLALGLEGVPNEAWATYDVLWKPEGHVPIKIEIKTSAYIQVWSQRRLSKPIFTIRGTQAWDPTTGKYMGGPKRHSDVYVFCLETYQGHGRPSPTNLDEWKFYIVPTNVLDERGHQKTISLSQITGELGVQPCAIRNLSEKIVEAVDGSRKGSHGEEAHA